MDTVTLVHVLFVFDVFMLGECEGAVNVSVGDGGGVVWITWFRYCV